MVPGFRYDMITGPVPVKLCTLNPGRMVGVLVQYRYSL